MTTAIERWRRKWLTVPLPRQHAGKVYDVETQRMIDGAVLWQRARQREFIAAAVKDARRRQGEPWARLLDLCIGSDARYTTKAGAWHPNIVHKTYSAKTEALGGGKFAVVASTGSRDRDNEVIEPGAWEKRLGTYRLHPIVVSSHRYDDLLRQIGESTWIGATGKGLKAHVQFYTQQGNVEADWAEVLASKGRLAFSVGFLPFRWTDGDGIKTPKRVYHEVELLELSACLIPSNREALVQT